MGTVADTIRIVLSLSSGTLARLFGTADYESIDKQLGAWVMWLSHGEQWYPTWQEAWTAYSER